MNKYAFLENVPGLSVKNYCVTFDDGEWFNLIEGLDGVDAVMERAKALIAEGYSLINLCGDFGEEHVSELMKEAPEGTEVHFAAYLPEELAKMEALEQYVEYGQIIFGNVQEPKRLELSAPEMNTHTVFVRDMEQALTEAKAFAKAGVDGIELCSGFDLDMTKQIIAAVESENAEVPVGSNGITV